MRSSTAVVAVLAVTVGAALVANQSPSTPDRRIVREFKPLAPQLRPDDRYVILDYGQSPPSMIGGPSEGGSRLEWLAKQSEVIVVVRVERVDSELVYRDILMREEVVPADEANWIVSRVQTRLENIVRGADELGKSVGEIVLLKAEGGTAVIRGTLVEAVVPWESPMVAGRRYLLFGHISDGEFVHRYGYGESSTGRLESMRRSAPPPPGFGRTTDDVEFWNLHQAVWMIRDAAQ